MFGASGSAKSDSQPQTSSEKREVEAKEAPAETSTLKTEPTTEKSDAKQQDSQDKQKYPWNQTNKVHLEDISQECFVTLFSHVQEQKEKKTWAEEAKKLECFMLKTKEKTDVIGDSTKEEPAQQDQCAQPKQDDSPPSHGPNEGHEKKAEETMTQKKEICKPKCQRKKDENLEPMYYAYSCVHI